MPLSAPFRLCLLSLALATLAGCGSGGTVPADPTPTPVPTPTPTPTPTPVSGAAFTGTVLSGTTPISGASVQLYAAGTTGNALGATALLSAALTSDASGNVSVPEIYSCPTSSSQLYLIARGGTVPLASPSASSPAAAANAAIALLAPVAICSAVTTGTHVVLNEVTTAASAWALAPFLAPDGTLGATRTNAAGLSNALATAQALIASAASGSSTPTDTQAVLRIHSLANLLNTCTATVAATSCASLFAAVAASSAPADTLAAALSLVRSPGRNVGALFQQSTASTAFLPALPTAPRDWTLFRTLTGGGMNAPSAVAADATGSIWVASFFGAVSEFSPSGDPILPSGVTGSGLNASYSVALDAQNNVWIPNREGGSANGGIGTVTELSSTGQPLSGATGYAQGGLNYPIGVATDTNGSTWVVDYGNSHLTILSASGQPLSGASGYVSDFFAFPVAVAVDANHNAWVANQGGTSITRVSPDGQTFLDSQCCMGASGLAIDALGVVWVANYYSNSISRVAADGSVLATRLTGGGIDHPQAIAVDGAGTVWVANYRTNTLSELTGSASANPGQALSPPAGFLLDAKLSEPSGLAVDSSGNLWLPNFGADTLTEVIGIATPVKTPLIGPSQLP